MLNNSEKRKVLVKCSLYLLSESFSDFLRNVRTGEKKLIIFNYCMS